MFERKVYVTSRQKQIDFIIGLVGYFVVNTILWLCFGLIGGAGLDALPASDVTDVLYGLIGCLPLLLNIIVVIYFAFTRPWIALGMLAAFAALFILAIIAGIFLAVACFVLLASGGGF